MCRGQGRVPRARQDLGHTTWPVGNGELCQLRTDAGGKPVTESNLSLRAARAKTRRYVWLSRGEGDPSCGAIVGHSARLAGAASWSPALLPSGGGFNTEARQDDIRDSPAPEALEAAWP
jgi:hypothetical protein